MKKIRPARLSIVIPTHNDVHSLALTLSSLERQTLAKELFEVIVVDDCSDVPAAKALAGKVPTLRLRHLRLTRNRGRSAARNMGIAAAVGDHVIFLDSDSFADPRLLELHHHFHSSPAGRDKVMAGKRYEINWGALEQITQGRRVTKSELGIVEEDLRSKFWILPEFRRAWSYAPWIFAYTHSISAPKAAIRKAGMFDERMRGWGHEDIDLAYRIHRNMRDGSTGFVFSTQSVCYHLPHYKDATGNRVSAEKNARYMREKYRSFEFELMGRDPYMVLAHKMQYYKQVIALLHKRNLGTIRAMAPSVGGNRILNIGHKNTDGGSGIRFDHAAKIGKYNRHLIGIRTDFDDGAFEKVFNFELWRFMYWSDFCAMIQECLRVSGELWLFYTQNLNLGGNDTRDLQYLNDTRYIHRAMNNHYEVTERRFHDGFAAIIVRPKRR